MEDSAVTIFGNAICHKVIHIYIIAFHVISNHFNLLNWKAVSTIIGKKKKKDNFLVSVLFHNNL